MTGNDFDEIKDFIPDFSEFETAQANNNLKEGSW
jgi:hypothetical protein